MCLGIQQIDVIANVLGKQPMNVLANMSGKQVYNTVAQYPITDVGDLGDVLA